MGGIVGGYHTFERAPLMSFNAYHHAALGWFDDRVLTVQPPSSTSFQTIRLAAFVDYDLTKSTDVVVVQMGTDLFFQYNRAKKFNAQPMEYRDEVVIVKTMGTVVGTELMGALSLTAAGGGETRYEVKQSNGLVLRIELCSEHRSPPYNADTVADYVIVSMGYYTPIDDDIGPPTACPNPQGGGGNGGGASPNFVPPDSGGRTSAAGPTTVDSSKGDESKLSTQLLTDSRGNLHRYHYYHRDLLQQTQPQTQPQQQQHLQLTQQQQQQQQQQYALPPSQQTKRRRHLKGS